jgi:hypothetical protein
MPYPLIFLPFAGIIRAVQVTPMKRFANTAFFAAEFLPCGDSAAATPFIQAVMILSHDFLLRMLIWKKTQF